MFEFMDGVVDALEELGQAADGGGILPDMRSQTGVDNNSASMAPPYAIWRKGHKQ